MFRTPGKEEVAKKDKLKSKDKPKVEQEIDQASDLDDQESASTAPVKVKLGVKLVKINLN